MLWSVPEERAPLEEIIAMVVAPKLHAALQLLHQADDVHAKALQTWFNPEEERAAILEAEAKLRRLSRRLEDIRTEPVEDEIAPRLRQLRARLGDHLREVETRKAQLVEGGAWPPCEEESARDGAGRTPSA
jgi:hypothetical protein